MMEEGTIIIGITDDEKLLLNPDESHLGKKEATLFSYELTRDLDSSLFRKKWDDDSLLTETQEEIIIESLTAKIRSMIEANRDFIKEIDLVKKEVLGMYLGIWLPYPDRNVNERVILILSLGNLFWLPIKGIHN